MDNIEYEIRALLNNFWIVKEQNPDLYYKIKLKQKDLRDFCVKKLNSELLIKERFIKLEKIDPICTDGLGIESFKEPLDYVLLCLVLLYLEDKMRGEIFLLSNLIDYVKNTSVTMNLTNIPDWNKVSNRRSLVRVIDFLKDIYIIKVKDEKNSFKDNQEAEALYEATGLANYVMRRFNGEIFNYETDEEYLKDEWINQDDEKGDVRKFRVYRSLLFRPATFHNELSINEFDYIKKMRGNMYQEFQKLGYELEVTRNMAFLYEYENNPLKENFPNNKKISDIVLMVNKKLYDMITSGKIKVNENEVGKITRESLEMILKDIKLNDVSYLSKYYKDLTLLKFCDEVIDYMIEYSFLKENHGIYEVMPSISRFLAKLETKDESQIDLFGGDINV